MSEAPPTTTTEATPLSVAGADHGVAGSHSQALIRQVNEAICRLADENGLDGNLDLVCECEQGDCFARLSILPELYEQVRFSRTRFLTKPDHVGRGERVVEASSAYAVVEKVGRSVDREGVVDSSRRADGGAAA